MRRALLPVTLLAAFAVGGCYSDAGVGYSADYSTGPSLAYVAPGVQVVADYDYPVFFSDGFYWQYYGGYWYRSPYWNRGWSATYNVPYAVRGISRPWAYAHYHPGTYWGGHGGVRGGVVVRDHRGYYGAGYYRGADGYYRQSGNTYRGNTYRGTAYRAAPVHRGGQARPGRVIVRDHRR
jgi:hypothetical protein